MEDAEELKRKNEKPHILRGRAAGSEKGTWRFQPSLLLHHRVLSTDLLEIHLGGRLAEFQVSVPENCLSKHV